MTHVARPRITTLALMALALAVAAVMFAALSPGGKGAAEFGAAPQTADAAAKTVKITIKDYKFSKPKLTIKVGTKVTWTNRDEMRHNATTSKKGGPHGPLLDKGDSYTWTATKKGTFKYHCQPHMAFMKAVITVK